MAKLYAKSNIDRLNALGNLMDAPSDLMDAPSDLIDAPMTLKVLP